MGMPYVFTNGTIANADEVNANFDYLNDDGVTRVIAIENALEILDIQAGLSLDGGQSAFMLRDITTSNVGHLSTINTTNTDAFYSSNSLNYTNGFADNSIINNQVISSQASYSFPLTAFYKGLVTEVRLTVSTAATGTVSIIQNSVTLATKSQAVTGAANLFSFAVGDYSALIDPTIAGGNFNVSMSVSTGTITLGGSGSFITETFRAQGTGNQANRSGGNDLASVKYQVDPTINYGDKVVETNMLTIGIEPNTFQFYTRGEETDGDASVTYDVSFDNGVNWQTDLNSGEQITVTNTGKQVIIKQNLKEGTSPNKASASGYALMFWDNS
jgi:hypothetical protein